METQILSSYRDTSVHLDMKTTAVSSPSFHQSSNPFNHMAASLQPKTVTKVTSGTQNNNASSIRKPKHPRYETLQARVDSFVGWPRRYVPKTPEELSTAGFFYIGSADRVTCFQCGITLRDWEEEHDPVTEHRRYAKTCQYIHQVVIEEGARSETGAQEGISTTGSVNTICDGIEKVNLNCEDKLSSLSSVQSGCSEPDIVVDSSNTDESQDICASISDVTNSDKNDASAASSLVESINTNDTKPQKRKLSKKMASLQAENKRLKEESVCRMCKHKQASILFLPCGHLVMCSDCAETVVDCIKCGKNILGTVRTYRA